MRPTDLQFKRPNESSMVFYFLNSTFSKKGFKFTSEKRFQPLPSQKIGIGPGSYNIAKSDAIFKRPNTVKIMKPILSSKNLKFDRYGDQVACDQDLKKCDQKQIKLIKIKLLKGDKIDKFSKKKSVSPSFKQIYEDGLFQEVLQMKHHNQQSQIIQKNR